MTFCETLDWQEKQRKKDHKQMQKMNTRKESSMCLGKKPNVGGMKYYEQKH